MQAFTKLTGFTAPLDRENVDTDAIIPKQFLKSIYRTGFGANLFDEWRYLDYGEPGKDCKNRPLNKDFFLNWDIYKNVTILLARDNFGCGSSREHAPWALLDYGFRVIIAPSFAEIFYNNCFKNGILPIILDKQVFIELFNVAAHTGGYYLTIDLEKQVITGPDKLTINFEVDKFRKHCLLNGLDDIGLTLQHTDEIKAFEQQYKAKNPWLFQ
jgi:3-isopropylmalate/(R)-2-methylmalate dehydratase small subunit